MKEITKYAKQITVPVEAIEYPKEDYNWNGLTENISTVVIPEFKNNNSYSI